MSKMSVTGAALLCSSLVFVGGCGEPAQEVPMAKGHNHNQDAHQDHTHGQEGHADHQPARARLDVQAEGEPEAGAPTMLRMSISGKDGRPARDFQESHEAMVHLIVVRAGLDQFAHLHPEVNAETGELTARYSFPAGGTYHLFADFQEPGAPAGVAEGTIEVGGEAPPAPILQPNAPGLVTVGGLSAKISIEGATAGGDATIRFELTTAEGEPVSDLEPHMGAMGHLNIISADAAQYVHSHPAGHDEVHNHGTNEMTNEVTSEVTNHATNQVTFVAHFPAAGLYKGWGQFKRRGLVQVVPFVLNVE